jgi:hypothetical protein
VCREFHRKKLSKRLLNAGSVDNMEETFLQRLKSQWGAQFTQKMEGMCSDLNTARVKQQEFTEWLRDQNKHLVGEVCADPHACMNTMKLEYYEAE